MASDRPPPDPNLATTRPHPKPTPSAAREVDRALRLLRSKIHERGFTQLRVQEALGWGRTYISQLLRRQKSLRYDQILQILEVIEVEPTDFFAELFELERPAPITRPGLSGPPQPVLPGASLGGPIAAEVLPDDDGPYASSRQDPHSTLVALVQLLMKKGLVHPEEVFGWEDLRSLLGEYPP